MQPRTGLARLATATTATVFLTVAALGPAFAADDNANENASGAATSSQGSEVSEEHRAEAASTSHGSETRVQGSSDTSSGAEAAGDASGSSATSGEVSGGAAVTVTTGPDHSEGNASTTGDADSPQPESNADQNDGGANAGECTETTRSHAYCSTRDGSPSENGVGDGEAKGKPCAGCVGKADNKNPKGQYPDGSDRNAGYECDRNQGIGKGNPAHTGCVTEEEKPKPEEKPTPKPEEKPTPKPEEKPTPKPEEKPVVVPEQPEQEEAPIVVPVGPVTPEAAPVPEVAPVDVAPVEQVAPPAFVEQEVAPAAGVLPAAGAEDYIPVLLAGIGLLALGGVLIARRRPQGR